MMYDDQFTIEEQEFTGTFKVTLSCSVRLFLDIKDKPESDEDKTFIWTPTELVEYREKARAKMGSLVQDAEDHRTLTRMGATTGDVYGLMCRKNDHELDPETLEMMSDKLYDPYEDYLFLYYFAGCLAAFVFEASQYDVS